MSQSLEDRLGRTLRHHRLHRFGEETALRKPRHAINDRYMETMRRVERFSTAIRPMIRDAAAHANGYFARMGADWELYDVSGCYTGPLYPSGGGCNPVAYELRVNGRQAGETLIIELSSNGMIEAFLAPWRPPILEAYTGRIDLGWHPLACHAFDPDAASDLLVRYVDRVTARYGSHWTRGPTQASPGLSGDGAP